MKVKSGIIFFAVFAISMQLSSQTMFDVFLALPDSAVYSTQVEQRQFMVNGYKESDFSYVEEKEVYLLIDTVDHKNGYMSMSGGLECFWEMCYWNLDKNNKLVAVNSLCCGPLCYTDMLVFFSWDGKKLTQLNTSEIIPEIWADFFKKNQAETEKLFGGDEGTMSSLLFNLPQEGLNIKAFFTLWELPELQKEYFYGNTMMLQWNKGTFTKSEIFWEEE
jgi:hypothetical protein